MQIFKTAKAAARRLLGPQLTNLVRRPFRPSLRYIAEYRSAFQSKRGLEIGGPSPILAHTGEIPIYDVLASLDNCLYSGNTIWAGEVRKGKTFFYQPGMQPGTQILCEATNLQAIDDSRYECVLACHCLEHVANPLRALAEWKRILQNEGPLLLILPHKDGTFDWRRRTTPLAHMIEDYENAVDEQDLTHLPEILALHDLSKDVPAGTKEQFEQRCLANHINRAMHHHVFDTMSAIALVNYAGFKILRVDTLAPYHIIILATRTVQAADNRRFLESGREHRSRSPFPSDHKLRNS
ncbi:MAG: class SAM-dependent methyltransferase [Candidatus Sulfotelmatobacter sp.]|nr:class SAM-dependent methyltransferase [Candidatus Sulfotelmatobacter sp.]